MGRPTSDPTIQLTITLPSSLVPNITPRGLESRSTRIAELIRVGATHEKKIKTKRIR